MGRGAGITLTVPSGAKVSVSPRYRYVLIIDADKGSWVEGRSESLKVLHTRRNNIQSLQVYLRAHIFDTKTKKRLT